MRKIWKIARWLVYALGGVFVVTFLIIVGIGQWHRPVGQADAIIVLGAAIKTPAAYNRAMQGLKLYNMGKAPVLVLSGGVDYPKSISEAQYMSEAAVSQATGPLNMILESSSQSTFENISNSKKLIPQAKSVIIVSDTYHLARGALTAKAAGFSPVYWDAPETASYYPLSELAFHYLRETAAMISYLPRFLLK